MFRLTNNRYFRISNRLAILAGLVLAVTALAGLPQAEQSAPPDAGTAAAVTRSADAPQDEEDVGAKSRWKVRFLLFTHG